MRPRNDAGRHATDQVLLLERHRLVRVLRHPLGYLRPRHNRGVAVLLDSERPYRSLCLAYGIDRLGLVLRLMEGLLSHWYLVRKLVQLSRSLILDLNCRQSLWPSEV